MITAIDTNILIDILNPSEPRRDSSMAALGQALVQGVAIISDVVYAELAARFARKSDLDAFLSETGTRILAANGDSLFLAGQAWRGYTDKRPDGLTCASCGAEVSPQCASCGRSVRARQHVLADFLIGAHAAIQADRLLTRDRGYYKTYFPDLTLA